MKMRKKNKFRYFFYMIVLLSLALIILPVSYTGAFPDTGATEMADAMGIQERASDVGLLSNGADSVIPGDANGDGVVDMADVIKIERIIVGIDSPTPGADANQDGTIDMSDAITIELIIFSSSVQTATPTPAETITLTPVPTAITSDIIPPYTSEWNPLNGANDVPVDAGISVHIRDDGAGVDSSTIKMYVQDTLVTPKINGSPGDYTVIYDPPSDFGQTDVVSVKVQAKDLASPPNVMDGDTCSFTIAEKHEKESSWVWPAITTGAGIVVLIVLGIFFLTAKRKRQKTA